MTYLSTFVLIGGLYLIAAASHGPNFLIISQLSLAGERHRACLVAAGITAGSTLGASSAMAGLAALLLHLSWLSLVLKLAGAAYLVWYGAPLWVYVATALMIAMLSATWHLGVALVFAVGPVQAIYRRLRCPIDAAVVRFWCCWGCALIWPAKSITPKYSRVDRSFKASQAEIDHAQPSYAADRATAGLRPPMIFG